MARPMELVGAVEIAELLGVSRARVHQLASRKEFPKPVATLAMGSIWRKRDIERWAETWPRRPGRPPRPKS
jgi:predicted DNA-binding transcriptional regulator AlpA